MFVFLFQSDNIIFSALNIHKNIKIEKMLNIKKIATPNINFDFEKL